MNTDPFEESDDAGPRHDWDEHGEYDREVEHEPASDSRRPGTSSQPIEPAGDGQKPELSCDVFCIGCVRCLADF